MNKKQLAKFNQDARVILFPLEAFKGKEDKDRTTYNLPKLGAWTVKLETETQQSGVWSIFTVFENGERYKGGHWKNNFHRFDSVDCLDDFEQFVNGLLKDIQ